MHSPAPMTYKNIPSFFLWTIRKLLALYISHPCFSSAVPQLLNLLHLSFSNTNPLLRLPIHQILKSPLLQAPRIPSLSHYGVQTSHWGRESWSQHMSLLPSTQKEERKPTLSSMVWNSRQCSCCSVVAQRHKCCLQISCLPSSQQLCPLHLSEEFCK